ncbi:MAG: GNAT family N-acetyltransferase [Rhizonema sp. PD37]|nr:GNAT family N-acetyltransferase [Rhizonema sp. PD37]
MLIRSATITDVPVILPMVAKLCALHESWDSAKFGFLPHLEQRYEGWLTQMVSQDRSVLLVAEDELQLVGFLEATVEREVPIYRLQEFAIIHEIWVEQEYRHQGIARQMVMLSIERFNQMGVKQIRLETAEVNESARQLFASCGFRTGTREMLIEL